MQHLNPDEVSRLADEPPTAAQSDHLDGCEECRMDVAAARAQLEDLSGLPPLRAPEGGWALLERRLWAEEPDRPLDSLPDPGRAAGQRHGWREPLLRIAAALAIFTAGGLTGGIVRGGGGIGDGADLPGRGGARTITVEQAQQAVLETEAEYIRALSRYAELSGDATPPDPANRLAALEGIVLTTGAALREAPADPIINGYHLTALTQREAILRHLQGEDGADDGWY